MSKLYKTIAKTFNWQKQVMSEKIDSVDAKKEEINNLLPSGSGIDAGSEVAWEKCSDNEIVIKSSFHCRDKGGESYNEWCNFYVIVKGSLINEIDIIIEPISNQDKALMIGHGLYGYLWDVFHHALTQEV